MNEVKAFIRSTKAEDVMEALNQLGVADITLIDVMGVGSHLIVGPLTLMKWLRPSAMRLLQVCLVMV